MAARKANRETVEYEKDFPDHSWIGQIRSRLLAWHSESARELPWQGERNPYKVLVSEMMLVQTTVAAVIPYYNRFIRQFPTVIDLAEADEELVLKAWEGLGYYRRARQLHATAKSIRDVHGGVFPTDPKSILELPGIGRYIAGAIRSFAFGQPAPIVEANTQRVLARWLSWPEDLKTTRSQTVLWGLAERLVPPDQPGRFNQAFMDLGATVCLPKDPLCLLCPVSDLCKSRALGTQDSVPALPVRAAPLAVEEACALIRGQDKIVVVKRADGGLWSGFWEFPTVHIKGVDPGRRSFPEPMSFEEGIYTLTGIRIETGPELPWFKYAVTKHQVTMRPRLASTIHWSDTTPTAGPGLVEAAWVEIEKLSELTMSSPSRKLVAWCIKNRKL